MLVTIRNHQDFFQLEGKSQTNSCALSTLKNEGKTEKHYCVVLAHHGKTDLHQLQAKHCSVSTQQKWLCLERNATWQLRSSPTLCPDKEQKSRLSTRSSLDKTHIYHICEQPRQELHELQLCSCLWVLGKRCLLRLPRSCASLCLAPSSCVTQNLTNKVI